jgi:hypothetical protein
VIDVTHRLGLPRSLESVMTVVRLIPLALRSGLLMAAGAGLIAAPFALGLDAAAMVTAVAIGGIMVALAVAGTDSSGRGTLPVSAQAVYDRGIALGLVLTALLFGVADQTEAALVFGIAGVAALIVTTITRYSARPV